MQRLRLTRIYYCAGVGILMRFADVLFIFSSSLFEPLFIPVPDPSDAVGSVSLVGSSEQPVNKPT